MSPDSDGRLDICAIILAAGSSERLGVPKQLLPYRDTTLLGHTIRCVMASKCSEVIVVLGAHAPSIHDSIFELPVHPVQNKYWRSGIASSIRTGLEEMEVINNNTRAALFLVCDQPFLTAKVIDSLIDLFLSGYTITASDYDGILGVPALFEKQYFPELKMLSNDSGAKKILHNRAEKIGAVLFPQGGIDVDRPGDLPDNLESSHTS